ncbi:hypothetical protein K439DRAFT_1549697, partial [Ramaria rubella]
MTPLTSLGKPQKRLRSMSPPNIEPPKCQKDLRPPHPDPKPSSSLNTHLAGLETQSDFVGPNTSNNQPEESSEATFMPSVNPLKPSLPPPPEPQPQLVQSDETIVTSLELPNISESLYQDAQFDAFAWLMRDQDIAQFLNIPIAPASSQAPPEISAALIHDIPHSLPPHLDKTQANSQLGIDGTGIQLSNMVDHSDQPHDATSEEPGGNMQPHFIEGAGTNISQSPSSKLQMAEYQHPPQTMQTPVVMLEHEHPPPAVKGVERPVTSLVETQEERSKQQRRMVPLPKLGHDIQCPRQRLQTPLPNPDLISPQEEQNVENRNAYKNPQKKVRLNPHKTRRPWTAAVRHSVSMAPTISHAPRVPYPPHQANPQPPPAPSIAQFYPRSHSSLNLCGNVQQDFMPESEN